MLNASAVGVPSRLTASTTRNPAFTVIVPVRVGLVVLITRLPCPALTSDPAENPPVRVSVFPVAAVVRALTTETTASPVPVAPKTSGAETVVPVAADPVASAPPVIGSGFAPATDKPGAGTPPALTGW